MEYTYKYRKYIARITYISLMFIFLLALCYKTWGGPCWKGSLADIVISQSNELEHCLLTGNNCNFILKASEDTKSFVNIDFIGAVILSTAFLSAGFTYGCKNNLFLNSRHTLVSLSVRMDE